MTWTKIPDDFPDRAIALSDQAFRLHICATAYCNRLGLDGRIPKGQLPLVPVPAKTRRMKVIAELVNSRLWDDDDDAWELRDFFQAQLSAEEVTFRRAYDAIRQRIRFASGPENKAVLRREEDAIKASLNEARERRRSLAAVEPHSVSHNATHSAPLRSVSDPLRSAPVTRARTEERGGGLTAPLRGAAAASDEGNPDVCRLCGKAFRPGENRKELAMSGHRLNGNNPAEVVHWSIYEHDRHPVKTWMCVVEFEEWQRKYPSLPNTEEAEAIRWAAANPAKPGDDDYIGPAPARIQPLRTGTLS